MNHVMGFLFVLLLPLAVWGKNCLDGVGEGLGKEGHINGHRDFEKLATKCWRPQDFLYIFYPLLLLQLGLTKTL